VLATVVVLAALAAGGWYGWHRWHGQDGAAAARPRTCVTPSAAPTPAAPAQVTVNVLNATDKVGLAHQVAAALRAQGLRIGKVGNTKLRVAGVASISYDPRSRAAAVTLAEYVPGATLVPATTGGVTLQLGPAFTALPAPAQVSAAHARDLASASPRPVVCTTP
jgi:LytR cell envelope-related transcriptional attenuator